MCYYFLVGKFLGLVFILTAIIAGFFVIGTNFSFVNEKLAAQTLEEVLPELPKINQVRGVYLTVNTALSGNVKKIIDLIKGSDVNSLVIDVKDGQRSYLNDDMKKLVRRLRFAGIFPIARLPVFQHNGEALAHQDWAIKTADGNLWRDSGGRFWIDPASKEYWQVILNEAREAAKMGFGEINLDYIRFPSDGHLDSTVYPFWDKKISRTEIINQFALFMKNGLRKDFPEIKLTADVFGYLLLRDNDLGIGQDVIQLANIFDVICPMVYPSHYDPGNFNFNQPATHPYEVVYQSLESGKKIFEKHKQEFTNIRPWIQDFDLVGVAYTPEMVRLQMKAITDAGLNQGWMIWNPNNRYREEVIKK